MNKDKYYSKAGVNALSASIVCSIFLFLQFFNHGWIQGLWSLWFVWMGLIITLNAKTWTEEDDEK